MSTTNQINESYRGNLIARLRAAKTTLERAKKGLPYSTKHQGIGVELKDALDMPLHSHTTISKWTSNVKNPNPRLSALERVSQQCPIRVPYKEETLAYFQSTIRERIAKLTSPDEIKLWENRLRNIEDKRKFGWIRIPLEMIKAYFEGKLSGYGEADDGDLEIIHLCYNNQIEAARRYLSTTFLSMNPMKRSGIREKKHVGSTKWDYVSPRFIMQAILSEFVNLEGFSPTSRKIIEQVAELKILERIPDTKAVAQMLHHALTPPTKTMIYYYYSKPKELEMIHALETPSFYISYKQPGEIRTEAKKYDLIRSACLNVVRSAMSINASMETKVQYMKNFISCTYIEGVPLMSMIEEGFGDEDLFIRCCKVALGIRISILDNERGLQIGIESVLDKASGMGLEGPSLVEALSCFSFRSKRPFFYKDTNGMTQTLYHNRIDSEAVIKFSFRTMHCSGNVTVFGGKILNISIFGGTEEDVKDCIAKIIVYLGLFQTHSLPNTDNPLGIMVSFLRKLELPQVRDIWCVAGLRPRARGLNDRLKDVCFENVKYELSSPTAMLDSYVEAEFNAYGDIQTYELPNGTEIRTGLVLTSNFAIAKAVKASMDEVMEKGVEVRGELKSFLIDSKTILKNAIADTAVSLAKYNSYLINGRNPPIDFFKEGNLAMTMLIKKCFFGAGDLRIIVRIHEGQKWNSINSRYSAGMEFSKHFFTCMLRSPAFSNTRRPETNHLKEIGANVELKIPGLTVSFPFFNEGNVRLEGDMLSLDFEPICNIRTLTVSPQENQTIIPRLLPCFDTTELGDYGKVIPCSEAICIEGLDYDWSKTKRGQKFNISGVCFQAVEDGSNVRDLSLEMERTLSGNDALIILERVNPRKRSMLDPISDQPSKFKYRQRGTISYEDLESAGPSGVSGKQSMERIGTGVESDDDEEEEEEMGSEHGSEEGEISDSD